MAFKDILKASQDLQSVALVGDAYSLVRKKKKKTNDFIGVGVRNIAGTSLIKAQADIVEGM